MPEFQELYSKFERIEDAYANFMDLNERLIDTPLSGDLKVLMEKFKNIQTTASNEKQQLEIDKREFDQGNIGLDQFSKRLSIRTTNVSNVTFDLDMEISPRLIRISRKLAEPVIEATKSLQKEHPVMVQEAQVLEDRMNEVKKEPDVVVRINKTLSLFDKAIELGKKVYPVAKEFAPILAKLAPLFI